MASSAAARTLTEQHRVAQVRLGAATAVQTRRMWTLLDPARLAETADAWAQAMLLLLARQHQISATVAAAYFRQFRTLEAGAEPSLTAPAVTFSSAAAQTSLMVTGPGRILSGVKAGRTTEQAAQIALGQVAGAATRQALKGGRDLLRVAVSQDPEALGWSRVTSGSPCAFCALLSGRGPVYRTEDTGAFQAHDSCACTIEPVFSRSTAWPPRARDFADLYAESAKGQDDPINAFRRAYDTADAAD